MRIAVLGATGAIGSRTVAAATASSHEVMAVSRRRPAALPTGAGWRQVDATDAGAVRAAVQSCDVVIATLGLPYDIRAWQHWRELTESAATGVRAAGRRLVWLENCYAYGLTTGPVDEQTPLAPVSAMGTARADSFRILEEARDKGLDLTVARAADFLGPDIETTVLAWTPLQRAGSGDRRHAWLPWVGDPDTRHSYALASDVADSLLQLATSDSPGVWHLPALAPTTGREICRTLGRIAGRPVRPLATPTILLRVAGLFSPMAAAASDMDYLTRHDFILDDSRFRRRFDSGAPSTVEEVLTSGLAPDRLAPQTGTQEPPPSTPPAQA